MKLDERIAFEHHHTTSYLGHAVDILREMSAKSIHCVVTSPPYFGLRQYGQDAAVDWPEITYAPLAGLEPITVSAQKVPFGEESTINAYVGHMVHIFRDVKRVLRNDGTCWLNLGDSWANDGKWGGHSGGKHANALHCSPIGRNKRYTGLKPKDQIMVPHRVALALQADGWFMRQDIVWSKPNAMPESVEDRCTKAHEFIFLLTKSKKYYYDGDAIAEPSGGWNGSTFDTERKLAVYPEIGRKPRNASGNKERKYGDDRGRPGSHLGANIPWEGGKERPQRARAEQLAKEAGLTEAHFEAIRAVGLSDAGQSQLLQTGAGRNAEEIIRLADEAKAVLGGYFREFMMSETRNARSVWSIPTKPFKDAHFAVFPPELPRRCILAGCPEGGTVLDLFAGSATTGEVARQLFRKCVLIERNPEYISIQKRRLKVEQLLLNLAA